MVPAIAAGEVPAEIPRLRWADASIDDLFATGVARSSTFRDLVDRVERSDVIVHVEPWPPDVRGRPGGAMWFVGAAGGHRHLRIAVNVTLPYVQAVALLGHELQHALEVAADPSVVSGATFEALYRRIGDRCDASPGSSAYDTRAARDVQHRITGDLRSPALRVLARRR
jgi:hypothetical protein